MHNMKRDTTRKKLVFTGWLITLLMMPTWVIASERPDEPANAFGTRLASVQMNQGDRAAEALRVRWTFDAPELNGFERKRLQTGMKVRGWRFGGVDNLYFGHARVGKKWGPGVVLDQGDMAVGINHRGIELRRKL